MLVEKKQVPLISIVIVTYNASSVLQACLNSIYDQLYQDIEIIVIDGLSTDGTAVILEKNSSKINFWVSEADTGIYNAMNKALKHVKGSWVLFLGADDELLPGFSEMAKELKDPSAIYYGSVYYNGRKCSGKVSPYNFAKLGLHHQAVFYPASVFNWLKYDEIYKIAADYVFNIICYSNKKIRFIFKDYIIARYNHTGLSATTHDELLLKNKSSLILKHFGSIIWLRYMMKIFKKKILSR